MKRNINICGINGFDWKGVFALFLLLWLCINLGQSVFTEMMSDEAYYYMYGEHLSWGYFDHPPMVGLMTYLSKLLFGGNLSVRFATTILQLLTLILIWKITAVSSPDTNKIVWFFLIAASFVMFQAYGFVTTPDAPLLFFAVLFLYAYKRFLKDESWLNTLFLAVSVAGMVYSKYHAVLIIGFVLLSNLRLLTRGKIWLAGLLALGLLAPHIYWQASNDFPSFQYHLGARSRSFRWIYFLEYIPNQLLVFNPFTLGAVVYVLAKYRPSDVFERGMYFLIYGLIVFFWATSFRGHVEPHWTVAASVPMMILLYRRSLEDKRLSSYIKKVVAPSLLLLLLTRVLLTTDLLPDSLHFSGKAEACQRIETLAGDLPVVFTGSFQPPSNYHFFTGKESFVLSAVVGRQTQFDLLEKELAYQGKAVFICQDNSVQSQPYLVNGLPVYGYFADSLQTVNRVRIRYTLEQTAVYPGDTLGIAFEMHNPTAHEIDFLHPEFPVSCRAAYVDGKEGEAYYAACELAEPILRLPAHTTLRGSLKTLVPRLEPANYQFTLTLLNSICAARNSAYVSLQIFRE
ncbi:MAG: glycosyltransferase family 39 protein [Tannerellaceae bacterium]|jgi:hypothetical protein|nr:glycosyltransferase family 39 protein [Tannerellaceae bacterium]